MLRGTVERLHVFTGSPDGGLPDAGLLEVGGLMYGTTLYGGMAGTTRGGTLSRFHPMTKARVVVYSFPSRLGDDFYYPNGLIASATTLYGTMVNGVAK